MPRILSIANERNSSDSLVLNRLEFPSRIIPGTCSSVGPFVKAIQERDGDADGAGWYARQLAEIQVHIHGLD